MKRGRKNRAGGPYFYPQLELLKNEMKIRSGEGARDPHRNSNQNKKTASKNEAVYLSSVED